MRLVITEKPSVARDLARVLGAERRGDGFLHGDGLRITWCLGHLVELEEPQHYDPAWRRWTLESLPMVPERFALRVRRDAADRFAVVRKLLRERGVREVINACDAGREGELIFRYVYELAGAAVPVKRLWLASLTESAIRHAWDRLRPSSELEPLAAAARCRSEADWLVGLNATRALTCRVRQAGGGGVLSIGRVQTPTLAMIVSRDQAIDAFVAEPFWQVRATFKVATPTVQAEWVGTWFRPSVAEREDRGKKRSSRDEAPQAERLPTAELAAALAEAVLDRPGRLEQSETRRQVDSPPLLYDLTTLQRRANARYGLSAQRTLEIAQRLYERHKLITYPRTDARHLTPDQVPELPGLARGLGRMRVYAGYVHDVLARWEQGARPGRRVIDASKVGDHHAILPTGTSAQDMGLTPDEKRVFDLVARRFLAALSDDALFDRTTLVVAVDAPPVDGIESPPRFRARGRVCVQQGWRAVDPPGRSKELELPRLEPAQRVHTQASEAVEGATRPPLPYNDGTLLKAMERAGSALDDAALKRAVRDSGLGTPATRAAILQTLLNRKFIERRGRELRATELGRALIAAVPAPELKSAELTGRWERRLAAMERGHEDRERFMADVATHVGELIDALCAGEPPQHPAFAASREAQGPAIADCPRCEGKVIERSKVYACDRCSFVIFKSMSSRPISKRMAVELIEAGQTRIYKGFRSKRTGKDFQAGLVIGEDGRVGMYFDDNPPPSRGSGGDGASGAAQRGVASGAGLDDRSGGSHRSGGTGDPSDQPAGSPPADAPSHPEGLTCPRCGEGNVLRGRRAWGCSRYAQGCGWVLPFADVDDPSQAVARILGG